MSVKDTKAEVSTITYDRDKIEDKVGSIYEAIVIMGKRAEQINAEIRTELHNKLDEFAIHNTTLEEVFENREQIEISKHYEKLPKPTSIAIEEWLNDEIYYRQTDNNNWFVFNEIKQPQKFSFAAFVLVCRKMSIFIKS